MDRVGSAASRGERDIPARLAQSAGEVAGAPPEHLDPHVCEELPGGDGGPGLARPEEAQAKGWTVVDMKIDWKRIFASE